jgi:hypothetical protein
MRFMMAIEPVGIFGRVCRRSDNPAGLGGLA